MDDQRTSRRRRVLKRGTIAFDGAGIDCLVRNISATGAALEVESQAGIPPEFKLIMSTEHLSALCRVLWRKAKRIGVVFQPGAAVDGARSLQPQTGASAPALSANPPVNPSTSPAPACIRSIDTLPEHPGPPLAPDYRC